MDDVEKNEVMMLNVMNEFDQLKITQFMEHRVYEEDIDKITAEALAKDEHVNQISEEEEKQRKQEHIRLNFLKALKYGEEALEKYSVVKEDASGADQNGYGDGDDAYDDEYQHDQYNEAANAARNEKRAAEMAQIHELFRPRKLPFLIGSREFMEDDMCGLEPQDDPGVVPTDVLLTQDEPESMPQGSSPNPNGETQDPNVLTAPGAPGEFPPSNENAPPPPPLPAHGGDMTGSDEADAAAGEDRFRPPTTIRPPSSFEESEEDNSADDGFNIDQIDKPEQQKKDDIFSSGGDLFNPEYNPDDEDDVFDLDELENQFAIPSSKKESTKPVRTNDLNIDDPSDNYDEPVTTTTAASKPKKTTGFSFFDEEEDEDDLTDILDMNFKSKPTKMPALTENEPKPEPSKEKSNDMLDEENEERIASSTTKKPAEQKKPAAKKSFFDDDLFGDDDDDDLLLGSSSKQSVAPKGNVDLFGELTGEAPPSTTTAKKSGLLDDFNLDVDDFEVPTETKAPEKKPKSVSFGKPTTDLFAGMDLEEEDDEIFGSSKPKKQNAPPKSESKPAPQEKPKADVAPVKAAPVLSTKKPEQPKMEPAASSGNAMQERKRAISSAMESSIMQGLMGGGRPQKKKPKPLPTSTKTTFDGGVSTRDHIDHVNLNKPKRKKRARRGIRTIQPLSDLPDSNGLSLPGETKKPTKVSTQQSVHLFSDLQPKKAAPKTTKAPATSTTKKASKGFGDLFSVSAKPKTKTSAKKTRSSAIDDDIFGSPMPVVTRTKKKKNEKQLKAAQALAPNDDLFAEFSSSTKKTSTKKETTAKKSKPAAAALDPFAEIEPKKKRKSTTSKKDDLDDLFGSVPVTKANRRSSRASNAKKATDDLDDIFGPVSKTKKSAKKSTKATKGDDMFGF